MKKTKYVISIIYLNESKEKREVISPPTKIPVTSSKATGTK